LNQAFCELEGVLDPCKLIVYAYDADVVASCDIKDKLVDLLKLTISRHFDWLDDIGMICNLDKTELVTFGLDDIEVVINGCLIKSSGITEVLGYRVDCKLTLGSSHSKNPSE